MCRYKPASLLISYNDFHQPQKISIFKNTDKFYYGRKLFVNKVTFLSIFK